MQKKIILYGAGCRAEMLFDCSGWKKDYQIIAIVDSDEYKLGKRLGGLEIVSLSDALKLMWDYFVICPRGNAYREIKAILDGAGISSERVLSFSTLYHCNESSSLKSECDKKKTGLVIIFNHRYEGNLPKLRKMYGSRFSEIRFLMPFYLGEEQDVISVYDTSYCFQGFITQAYTQLMEIDVDYFLFIGDDLIINTEIDEWNATEKLGLSKEKEIFCFSCWELNAKGGFQWSHTRKSSNPFYVKGMLWRNELPSKEEAFKLFEEFMGRAYPRQYSNALFQGCSYSEEEKELFYESNGGTKDVPYPMARGYSDIFAIKKNSMKKFAHMFGVFASMNMFVEIAIPTAIVLTAKRSNVSFEMETAFDYEMIFWGEDKIDLAGKYENSINNLMEHFPEGCLCIHPIKLSRWTI